MELALLEALKMVAPGTKLREGLDNIIDGKTGALIVVGNTKEVLDIIHGGFYINCEYSPSHIYELSKMDGAIILSSDCKKILYANVQLFPCRLIPSHETGTRHKTAERVAKQTGLLVIAISQRRGVITLYRGSYKYVLKDISDILNKANQAVQTLGKYKNSLDKAMDSLTSLEFKNRVSLYEVARAIQKMEMVWRIGNEINFFISELGTEGRLLNMQVKELMEGVKEDRVNLIKDYVKGQYKDLKSLIDKIGQLDYNELLDLDLISNLLGYDEGVNTLDIKVEPRGFRILSKIPRIPSNILENLINASGTLEKIVNTSPQELNSIPGIGKVRSASIAEGLKRLKNEYL